VNRLVLEELLQGESAQVDFAENGRIAVDKVRASGTRAWDLVLMDIQMPEIGGFEATRHILSLDPQLPIIGLTAHAMAQDRQQCLDAGMVAHLAKPYALEELIAAILRHGGIPRSGGLAGILMQRPSAAYSHRW
jgi:CheY-like chemotaxis protein